MAANASGLRGTGNPSRSVSSAESVPVFTAGEFGFLFECLLLVGRRGKSL